MCFLPICTSVLCIRGYWLQFENPLLNRALIFLEGIELLVTSNTKIINMLQTEPLLIFQGNTKPTELPDPHLASEDFFDIPSSLTVVSAFPVLLLLIKPPITCCK